MLKNVYKSKCVRFNEIILIIIKMKMKKGLYKKNILRRRHRQKIY